MREDAPLRIDQPSLRRVHFGQPVAPGAGDEPVPALGERRVGEAVNAAEVDDDRPVGRLEGRSLPAKTIKFSP